MYVTCLWEFLMNKDVYLSPSVLCSDRLCGPQAVDDVLDQANGHGSDGWLSVERTYVASHLPRYVVVG